MPAAELFARLDAIDLKTVRSVWPENQFFLFCNWVFFV